MQESASPSSTQGKRSKPARPARKSAGNSGSTNSASEINRRINALVMLLEDKGVFEPGDFEDAVMNLKVQLGDQSGLPANTGIEARSQSEYRGPERREAPGGTRETGQDRRTPARGPAGHVSGRISSEADGHPISGVQLILRRGSPGGRSTQFRSTKSDQQGRFAFLNLPMIREGDHAESYHYDLEVRYRNRTIHDGVAMDLIAGQTLNRDFRVPVDNVE